MQTTTDKAAAAAASLNWRGRRRFRRLNGGDGLRTSKFAVEQCEIVPVISCGIGLSLSRAAPYHKALRACLFSLKKITCHISPALESPENIQPVGLPQPVSSGPCRDAQIINCVKCWYVLWTIFSQ